MYISFVLFFFYEMVDWSQMCCSLSIHQTSDQCYISISIQHQLRLLSQSYINFKLYQVRPVISRWQLSWLCFSFDGWLVRLMEKAHMWHCQNLATRLSSSVWRTGNNKRQPRVEAGASLSVGLRPCSVFNGWLSSCQVHAGLKVATGWVCR